MKLRWESCCSTFFWTSKYISNVVVSPWKGCFQLNCWIKFINKLGWAIDRFHHMISMKCAWQYTLDRMYVDRNACNYNWLIGFCFVFLSFFLLTTTLQWVVYISSHDIYIGCMFSSVFDRWKHVMKLFFNIQHNRPIVYPRKMVNTTTRTIACIHIISDMKMVLFYS